jgi:alpha-D-xyloside xylohydrolase
MKEVLTRYTDLTGKPSLPAPWTFGLWLSTSFTTNYDEATVMSFIDGMLNRGIPLRTFHFDCFWMKEFHWCDFEWDSRVFPDPKGLLKRIKAKGLNICVWINSYIAQESPLFDEGVEKGYFIKRTNGKVWQWDMWQPGMAIVDFTNPEACRWYQDKLEVLLDMGVDCFKTDFGERIPTEDVMYFDGSDPKKMHNYYTYLYNKCVYELLERKRGKGEAVLFARSATVGGQKFPVHWGGDCWSDYESMEESLRGGLSLLMSGFGFWAHDIGGFENTSTADVYKRWVAFGLLSSHSRLHGSSSYRVPWVYDEEAVDVVRFFTRLKASLMPYIYKTAVDASVSGVPTMRSMVLEFTEDKTCHYVDKQYMLGDNLLVAPIFNDQSIAEYYLPAGTWTDFFTGEVKEGGRWVKETHGYLSIPLMVKENSIVAIGAHDDKPDYDYGENAELRVYALQDGKEASAVVYGMDKAEEIVMRAERTGNQLQITVQSEKDYTIRLVNVIALSVSKGDVRIDKKDTIISLSKDAELTVTF